LKKPRLVGVAYSHVVSAYFPAEEAYQAEQEVEERAAQVLEVMYQSGIPGRQYSADEHFLTNLLVWSQPGSALHRGVGAIVRGKV
jgi:hypothetical protein